MIYYRSIIVSIDSTAMAKSKALPNSQSCQSPSDPPWSTLLQGPGPQVINTSLDGSNPQNPGPMHFIWDHRPSSQSLQTTNHIIIGYLRQTKHDMISPPKIIFG